MHTLASTLVLSYRIHTLNMHTLVCIVHFPHIQVCYEIWTATANCDAATATLRHVPWYPTLTPHACFLVASSQMFAVLR